MASKKTGKKESKPDKPIEKPIKKIGKKMKKKNYQSFSIYIYKLLKSLENAKNVGISRKTMQIMNSLLLDMIEEIATTASRFAVHGKKTLGSREIQYAIKLLMPLELAKHTNL
ncbi:Histone H2B type 1-A [Eumeta japonica]|uniref:Histone H2B type 1-A n=1 Tax=Eumeta variegata TaxID=151549 RepID=A0A4C1SIP8_EUMVA|nr:Histone H2B type 1-A [Eumeta japonica]